eukprot:356981-Chlamydomonas_euryale.AAC.2
MLSCSCPRLMLKHAQTVGMMIQPPQIQDKAQTVRQNPGEAFGCSVPHQQRLPPLSHAPFPSLPLHLLAAVQQRHQLIKNRLFDDALLVEARRKLLDIHALLDALHISVHICAMAAVSKDGRHGGSKVRL